MADKGTNWSITINNPTKEDDENLGLARQKGWKVEGQLEKGDNGTPHYQLLITTKGQQRFSALKKAFPRAHIELARNVEALKVYVKKESTRIGLIPQLDLYPSMTVVMGWFGEEFSLYGKEYDGVEDRQMLIIFDRMVNKKIREGYFLESMAVNPQVRSSINMYGRAIAHRGRVRRQTDRQTDKACVVEVDLISSLGDINNASQEISIPETTKVPEESSEGEESE